MNKYECNLCGMLFVHEIDRLSVHEKWHNPHTKMRTKNRIRGIVKWKILQ